MKFVFLIPLRNASVARNWESCVELCIKTILSASQQTAHEDCFQVVLVCRDFPEISLPSNVKILRAPFPDPEPNWESQHVDKYAKIRFGLEHLVEQAPLYIMKLDADDLVSNKIVSWVLADDNKNGYYVDKGYRWFSGRKWMEPVDNFHSECGSSNILYVEKNDLLKDNIYESKILKLGHNITVQYFNDIKKPLKEIPFSAVIYRKSNGENITLHYLPSGTKCNKPNFKFYIGKYITKILHRRVFLSKRIKSEFSL